MTQSVYGLETCMHLTCTGMPQSKVDDALKVCFLFWNDLVNGIIWDGWIGLANFWGCRKHTKLVVKIFLL